MVPVYSIQAWLALRFRKKAVPISIVREGYEAFVIFSFVQLLLAYLGGPVHLGRRLDAERQQGSRMHHLAWPFTLLTPWKLGPQFLRKAIVGTVQFIPASLVVMLISATTFALGRFGEGSFNPTKGYVYVSIIKNFSQCWAMYCLVLLYKQVKEDLSPINPFGKFLCIKLVVFFTFWQAIAISLLEPVSSSYVLVSCVIIKLLSLFVFFTS